MKTALTLCLILLSIQISQATHLLGGYIQAKPVAGSAGSYQITAVLYMDEIRGKPAADQATSISVCFGDGSIGIAYRASRLLINDKSTSINSYSAIHTYSGPGIYQLAVSQSNRTGVKNITNADGQLFTLRTTFSITSPTANQTPTPGFPQNGFHIEANRKATLLLTATDADGDSLVYGLAKPLTNTSQDQCSYRPLTSYQFPNDLTKKGTFKINSRTGELVWDAPTEVGYYSVAITLDEYRGGNLISQTVQEIPLIVDDLPGTPGTIPPYEPAFEGAFTGLVTAVEGREDVNFHLITFPNPVDDRLQVVIQTSNPTTATVQLSDANGRKLHELSFPRLTRQHEQVISLSSLAPGVYLIQAVVGGRTLVRKVVKR
ncbi:T9SS type A sorting domain-containing protein [Spirosoma horti]